MERRPLHASATSSVMLGNMRTFPSCQTTMPRAFMDRTDTLVTNSFSGNAAAS